LKILIAVWAALVVLTIVTVAVTYVPAELLGPLTLWVALGIAGLKASLVALYFMHLRWDRPLNGIMAISITVVIMFVAGALTDRRVPGRDDPRLRPRHAAGAAARLAMTRERASSDPGTSSLGMTLFLISLSVLFAAAIAGYLLVRLRSAQWVPPGVAPLPLGLWASTLLLLVSSATMQGALLAIRGGKRETCARLLLATLALGAGFLLVQIYNWWKMVAVDAVLATRSLYAFTFYMLTGLHALHVVGGLIPLSVTGWRARRGAYSWADFQGVRLMGMYWHFLGAVWLVLFFVLLMAT
jgi:cytochrome c oxidase subunit 3